MSDTESSTPAPTPPCALLRFPSEIRNRIWTLVAIVETVEVPCDSEHRTSGKYDHPTTMALASTCRQIYREVTPIYYSKNMFAFDYTSLDAPRQFAAAIGPANAESMTAIGFYSSTKRTPPSLQSLRELLRFPNLEAVWDCKHYGLYRRYKAAIQET